MGKDSYHLWVNAAKFLCKSQLSHISDMSALNEDDPFLEKM